MTCVLHGYVLILIPNKYSKICSLHFDQTDFVTCFSGWYEGELNRTVGDCKYCYGEAEKKVKRRCSTIKISECTFMLANSNATTPIDNNKIFISYSSFLFYFNSFLFIFFFSYLILFHIDGCYEVSWIHWRQCKNQQLFRNFKKIIKS
ncbi:hypothetical protein HELRODRAFT_171149 [Helobdella robusta]|uniref:Uncharacterized protein n=1 Tax=Helobdella robusta TaxID=6412 RepID=T1F3V3_HELRO|nr:hypothetical protein HELRODRAFT_171149 [Helobdella robusta]ESO05511.1 hypothetical protein HELRODRAFT_171149 [Helobdella robusta]